MMQKLTFLLSMCFSGLVALAQQTQSSAPPKTEKIFYAEVGGPGILFSANLDFRFKKNTRLGWGMRGGLGFFSYQRETVTLIPGSGGFPGYNYDYNTETIATFPVGINYVFGKPNSPHMFETGFGGTLFSAKANALTYEDYREGRGILHFSFMYRRAPLDGGFSWRIGFVPVINTAGNVFPSAAIGLGYAFR
jgi:hypothetical protein